MKKRPIQREFKSEIECLQELIRIFRRNTRWTFWGFIGVVITILLAILMFQPRVINIGAGEPTEQVFSHLDSSPSLLLSSEGQKGAIITSSGNSPLLNLMYDIIDCESNFNQDAIGQAGEIGLAQFKKPTFEWMKGLAKKEELSIYNADDQMKLLLWALQNGYESHWTCYNLVQK